MEDLRDDLQSENLQKEDHDERGRDESGRDLASKAKKRILPPVTSSRGERPIVAKRIRASF
jgi:hypothetical protein